MSISTIDPTPAHPHHAGASEGSARAGLTGLRRRAVIQYVIAAVVLVVGLAAATSNPGITEVAIWAYTLWCVPVLTAYLATSFVMEACEEPWAGKARFLNPLRRVIVALYRLTKPAVDGILYVIYKMPLARLGVAWESNRQFRARARSLGYDEKGRVETSENKKFSGLFLAVANAFSRARRGGPLVRVTIPSKLVAAAVRKDRVIAPGEREIDLSGAWAMMIVGFVICPALLAALGG